MQETCELTLHDILHAGQVCKDLKVVLGSPALFHVGISSVAAGTTPRGVPKLFLPNKAVAGFLLSSSRYAEFNVWFCTGGLSEECERWGGGVVLEMIYRAALRQPPRAAYRRSPIPFFISGLTAIYDLSQPLWADDVASTFGS